MPQPKAAGAATQSTSQTEMQSTANLTQIARLASGTKAASADLREIATMSLCVRYHRDQAQSVAVEWQERMTAAQSSEALERHVGSSQPDYDEEPTRQEETYRPMSRTEMEESISVAVEQALRAERIQMMEYMMSEREEHERVKRELEEKKQQEQRGQEKLEKGQDEKEQEVKEQEEEEQEEKEQKEKSQENLVLAQDTCTKRWPALKKMPSSFTTIFNKVFARTSSPATTLLKQSGQLLQAFVLYLLVLHVRHYLSSMDPAQQRASADHLLTAARS